MSDFAVVAYPDPRLAAPADPVTDFGPDLAALAARLDRALVEIPAIGLAAPHLGVGLRVVAVRLGEPEAARFYVNPAVVWRSVATERHTEGSVSMPGVAVEIERPASVRVAFRHLDGRVDEEEASGFAAAVLCHEIDQLDGVFFIERLSRLRRERLLKHWRKSRR